MVKLRNGSRVVYLLLSYNHEGYIEQAVQSALQQDFSPLDIFISDDCSSDATFARIERTIAAYAGPHRVSLNRNKVRLGSVSHLSSLVDRLGDAFVVTAHGDDVAMPHRTRSLVEAWRAQQVSMVSSAVFDSVIDYTGRPSREITAQDIVRDGWMPEMLGAALAFDTRIFTRFERLEGSRLAAGLDHVLPLRAALLDGFYFVSDKLIEYRRHADNMSNFITDRSSGKDILAEGIAAYELAIRNVQRRDILLTLRRRKFSWRLRRLLSACEAKLFDEIGVMAEHRARLSHSGLVATWMSKVEIRARLQNGLAA